MLNFLENKVKLSSHWKESKVKGRKTDALEQKNTTGCSLIKLQKNQPKIWRRTVMHTLQGSILTTIQRSNIWIGQLNDISKFTYNKNYM